MARKPRMPRKPSTKLIRRNPMGPRLNSEFYKLPDGSVLMSRFSPPGRMRINPRPKRFARLNPRARRNADAYTIAQAEELYLEAKLLLLYAEQFWAEFYSKVSRDWVDAPKCKTMQVRYDPTVSRVMLEMNPEFTLSMTPDQVAGVLKHECLHLSQHHLWRKCEDRPFNPYLWNIACDIVVNHYIINVNSPLTLPPGCITEKTPEYAVFLEGKMSSDPRAEDIYRLIWDGLENRPQQPPEDGDGDGEDEDGEGEDENDGGGGGGEGDDDGDGDGDGGGGEDGDDGEGQGEDGSIPHPGHPGRKPKKGKGTPSPYPIPGEKPDPNAKAPKTAKEKAEQAAADKIRKDIKDDPTGHNWVPGNPNDPDVKEGQEIVHEIFQEVIDKCGVPGSAAGPIGDLKRYLEQKKKPAVLDWKEVLRNFARTCGSTYIKGTMKRESRRFADDENWTPGLRVKRRRRLLIAFDISRSVQDAEQIALWHELHGIWDNGNVIIDYIAGDVRIAYPKQVNGDETYVYDGKAGPFPAGGGTDWTPFYDFLNRNSNKYDGMILLTDGEYAIPGWGTVPYTSKDVLILATHKGYADYHISVGRNAVWLNLASAKANTTRFISNPRSARRNPVARSNPFYAGMYDISDALGNIEDAYTFTNSFHRRSD